MNVPIASDVLAPGAALPMDADPRETQEWREAFEALIASQGPERARFVLDELARLALEFRPELVVIADEARYDELKQALAGTNVGVAAGPAAARSPAKACCTGRANSSWAP